MSEEERRRGGGEPKPSPPRIIKWEELEQDGRQEEQSTQNDTEEQS